MYAGLNGAQTQTGNNNRNKISPAHRRRLRAGRQDHAARRLRTLLGADSVRPAEHARLLADDAARSPRTTATRRPRHHSRIRSRPDCYRSWAMRRARWPASARRSVSSTRITARRTCINTRSTSSARCPSACTALAGYVGTTSLDGARLGTLNINQLNPSLWSQGSALNADRRRIPTTAPGGPGFIGSRTMTRAQLADAVPAVRRR